MANPDEKKRESVRDFLLRPENREKGNSLVSAEFTDVGQSVSHEFVREQRNHLMSQGHSFPDRLLGCDGKRHPRDEVAAAKLKKSREAEKAARQAAKETKEGPYRARARLLDEGKSDAEIIASVKEKHDHEFTPRDIRAFRAEREEMAKCGYIDWRQREEEKKQARLLSQDEKIEIFAAPADWMIGIPEPEEPLFPKDCARPHELVCEQLTKMHSFCRRIDGEFGGVAGLMERWRTDDISDTLNAWSIASAELRRGLDELRRFARERGAGQE